MSNTYSQLAFDTFVRANENPLSDGGNWFIIASLGTGLQINTNLVQDSSNNVNAIGIFTGFNGNLWPGDQFSECVVATYTQLSNNCDLGLVVRCDTAGANLYFAELVAGDLGGSCEVELGKVVGGSGTSLGTFNGVFNAGDILRMEAQGTTITVYQNGVSIISVTDASVASGTPGIVNYSFSNPPGSRIGGLGTVAPIQEFNPLTGWDAGSIYAGAVVSVGLVPSTVSYPTTSLGTVTLSIPAPIGGTIVTLMSSNTAVATVPATVIVLAGNTTANFTVTTLNAIGNSTISASIGGGSSASAALHVVVPTYSISGTVEVAGATVNYAGTSSGSVVSGAFGDYTIPSLTNGSYAITPTLANYVFSPLSQNEVVAGANITGVNFTATATGLIQLVNGHVQYPSNLAVPLGTVELVLNCDATGLVSPYGLVMASIPIIFQFDVNGDIQADAFIWSNAELSPQNSNGLGTYYQVVFYDSNGARINNVPLTWQFTQSGGTIVDIGSMPAYDDGN